jgi:hypothetical protein
MAAVDEILSTIPLDQLAARVGARPDEVEQAARAALPALLGGLEANAADPAGAASLTEALGQHDSALVEGGVNLDDVDEGDGQKIAHHIFGDNEDQVVSQLGGVGSASSGLIAKLIPLLAPIVLSWLARQVMGGGRAPQGGSGGGLQDILGQVLAGATRSDQSGGAGGMSAGSIITDVLGGLLGGGRR